MKKILVTTMALSGLLTAGGDVVSVEPAVEPVVEPVMETPIMSESQRSMYLGLGLAGVSARDTDTDLSFFDEEAGQDRLGNVALIGGYCLNRYIALEGRFTTTFAESDVVELEGYSLFVKPQYSLSNEIGIYALLGYGHVEIDDTDVSEEAFQWGLGISYAATDEIELFMDYTSLGSDMDDVMIEWDADAWTIGAAYHF